MKRFFILYSLLVLVVPMTVLAEPFEVTIVSSLPRTGSANAQSTSIVNGIRMAIEDLGKDIPNLKISYEDWDDASPERGSWDPAVEAGNAAKAVSNPKIMAYIGTYNSGAAKISMPKLNEAGLLMISPAATWPGLTKPGKGEPNEPTLYRPSGKISFFRVVPADDIQGKVAAHWVKDMGVTSVYVLHDRELYGKGVAEMFKRASEDLAISVLGFEGIDPKASNYRSLATKIRQKNPALVYFGGTTQTNAGQIAKDLKSAGVKAFFMVPDGCYENAFIQSAGANNLNGTTLVTFGGVPPDRLSGKGKQFFDHYKAKYQTVPEGYAAYGYEATAVVLAALKRLEKPDRQALIAEVSKTKNYEGLLGNWSFDENGDTTLSTMSGIKVENGDFQFVKLLTQ